MAGDRDPRTGVDPRRIGGIPLRAFAPNAITALALCFGLTGVRFAIGEEWEKALAAVIFAGVLDGMDGRIARLLRAQSKFGAELDSLSDVIAFGVAPAMILFLWSLDDAPKFGWTAALALAVMISAIPTYSWSSIRLRRSWRLFALAGVGLLGAELVTAPWPTLLAICVFYVGLLPFGLASYAKVRRRG